MKARTVFLALSMLATTVAQGESMDTSCAPHSIAALDARAAQGDPRAQFWRGTQLEMGECGSKDSERANSLFHQLKGSASIKGVRAL